MDSDTPSHESHHAAEGFTDATMHVSNVPESRYPHSHVYMGVLWTHSPTPAAFSLWFHEWLDQLSAEDDLLLPAIQRQFPRAWIIVDKFYKLSTLKIRPHPTKQIDFEPILLSVAFNREAAQKFYPSILAFIGLLEVFHLVISADPEGKIALGLRLSF